MRDDLQPLPPGLDTLDVRFAIRAVSQSAILAKAVQSEMIVPALTKQDRSPVTVADFVVQAAIGGLLEAHLPQDTLVAEEDVDALQEKDGRAVLDAVVKFVAKVHAQAQPASVCAWIQRGAGQPGGRFWVLDPVDGTKGFLRGGQYAVALALVVDGQVQIGVLGCPNLSSTHTNEGGSLIVAVHGCGTWRRPLEDDTGEFQRLRVSDCQNTREIRLLRSFESGHTDVSQIDQFSKMLKIKADPVRMDSQAKYGLLAAGEGDLLLRLLSPGMLDYKEKIWDQAAGAIVVEEAGGYISDLDGRPLDFSQGRTLKENRGVVASNGHLHKAALEALERLGNESK